MLTALILTAILQANQCQGCDLYELEFIVHDPTNHVADLHAAYPPNLTAFYWPCDPKGNPPGNPTTGSNCWQSVGSPTTPQTYTMAYRVHNSFGWGQWVTVTQSAALGPSTTKKRPTQKRAHP